MLVACLQNFGILRILEFFKWAIIKKKMLAPSLILKYTRASHNAALNSADLDIALMTKKFWKFLHSAEPWYSADKNLKNNLHNAKTLV